MENLLLPEIDCSQRNSYERHQGCLDTVNITKQKPNFSTKQAGKITSVILWVEIMKSPFI